MYAKIPVAAEVRGAQVGQAAVVVPVVAVAQVEAVVVREDQVVLAWAVLVD